MQFLENMGEGFGGPKALPEPAKVNYFSSLKL
jgi:hypothetical protein